MNFSVTIPELFYDLIGRVVPGATFIIGLYIINPNLKILIIPVYLKGFSLFLVLVLLSYVMGFILGAIFSYVEKICPDGFSRFLTSKEYQKKYPPIILQTVNPVLSKEYGDLDKLTDEQIDRTYEVTSDWIRLKKPEWGIQLLKLDAEVEMLSNLLIAFVLLSVLSIFCLVQFLGSCICYNDLLFYKLLFLLIFLISACLSRRNLKKQNEVRYKRVVNHLYTLLKIESEELEKQAKQQGQQNA